MSSAARLFGTEGKASELKSARRRIFFMAFFILLLFAMIVARLFNLQILQHDKFNTLARENHVRLQPVPPPRGRIYSSDNVLLAGNVPSYNLMLRSEYLDVDSRRQLAAALRGVLPDLNVSEAIELHGKRRSSVHDPVLLWSGLDDIQRDRILVKQHALPGIEVVTAHRRFYPLADAGLHLLGYVAGVTAVELEDEGTKDILRLIGYSGKVGIEREYEDWLRGEAGSNNVEVDASGRFLRVLSSEPPQAGNDLHLSIDASLQLDAYHALADRRGAVVAIEAQSGKVRALVSSPATDPNDFAAGSGAGIMRLKVHQGNLFNRALSGQYPPGSTIKPFFALAALYHDTEIAKNTLWCNGGFQIGGRGRVYRDWKTHGEIDLHLSLVTSCDVFYYKLALELGIERSGDFLRSFGFGELSKLGLPEEKAGLVPSDAWKQQRVGERWYAGDSVSYGIGQGYMLATPMQLALATANLFSDNGKVVPVLLEDGKGRRLAAADWQANKEHLQMVRDGMRGVVHHPTRGTARAQARKIDFTIAGKTGTAQVVRLKEREPGEEIPEEEEDHSLFILYGPLDEPGNEDFGVAPIAMAVVVENAGGGSKVAAPLAVQLLKDYVKRAQHAEVSRP